MESDEEQPAGGQKFGQRPAETSDQKTARAKVRLVVMDVLMTRTDVHPAMVAAATAALMRAMQDRSTEWAFRVHAGGTRTAGVETI